jgi:thiol:disulfide interchange protein
MTPRSLLPSLLAAALIALSAPAAPPPSGPYDPKADASAELHAAATKAAASGKRILVVVGGNWCGWCRALDRLMNEDPAIRSELAAYQLVHVNYSKENENEKLMLSLGRPDKLGFPALVVLSPKLEVLVKQESGSLETGDKKVKGHDPTKVAAFLKAWSPRFIQRSD